MLHLHSTFIQRLHIDCTRTPLQQKVCPLYDCVAHLKTPREYTFSTLAGQPPFLCHTIDDKLSRGDEKPPLENPMALGQFI